MHEQHLERLAAKQQDPGSALGHGHKSGGRVPRQSDGPDADDIARFYAAHARALVAYFARRTFDPQAASELMAETFASAVADRRAFRGDGDEAAAAWLYGIARHQLSGWYRSAAVERRMLGRLGLEPPVLSDVEYERVEELAGLARAARPGGVAARGAPGRVARRAAPAGRRGAPVPGGRRGAGDRRAGGPRAGVACAARPGRGARGREERGAGIARRGHGGAAAARLRRRQAAMRRAAAARARAGGELPASRRSATRSSRPPRSCVDRGVRRAARRPGAQPRRRRCGRSRSRSRDAARRGHQRRRRPRSCCGETVVQPPDPGVGAGRADAARRHRGGQPAARAGPRERAAVDDPGRALEDRLHVHDRRPGPGRRVRARPASTACSGACPASSRTRAGRAGRSPARG